MPQQIKRKILKYFRITAPIITIGILVILLVIIIRNLIPLFRFCGENNLSPEFFLRLIKNEQTHIKNYRGRTNIVLLGIGDKSHEGYDLTDTIIFLSINFGKKDALLISLPRDIWLPTIKDRINSAYHYGEEKKPGAGLIMAKSAVEEIFGQPIHYAYLIDFSGFRKAIDLLDGIRVNVLREFTDNNYPIEGRENDFCGGDQTFACRYEKLHFSTGWRDMDGESALKYVRSRYAQGEEGTDFARSKRQQQVIVALKDKLIISKFYFKPDLIKKLFNAYNQIITTDMNWSEQITLFKFFFTLPDGKIRSAVLDTGDEKKGVKGYLINPPLWQYDGAWVLVPRTGDFGEIKQFVSCQIENPDCQLKPD